MMLCQAMNGIVCEYEKKKITKIYILSCQSYSSDFNYYCYSFVRKKNPKNYCVPMIPLRDSNEMTCHTTFI